MRNQLQQWLGGPSVFCEHHILGTGYGSWGLRLAGPLPIGPADSSVTAEIILLIPQFWS